jgi:nicotinamidase-related amidase
MASSSTTNTALILLDIQKGIMMGNFPDKTPEYISQASKLLKAVRSANKSGNQPSITIVHVNVAFRPGRPEISPASSMNSRLKGVPANVFVEGDQSVAFFDELGLRSKADGGEATGDIMQEEDVFVTKRRVSALSGTDLATVLRGREVDHLVLCGVATAGAVLSTVRQAADLDYKLTILKDLCLDKDDEVHRVLMEKVFPMQAEVLEADEWVARGFV